jgi:hypothetical protein
MFSAEEPIVNSIGTTCYNKAYSSMGSALAGIQIVYSGVYTVMNGSVIGLGIIASICLLKDPAGLPELQKS